LSRNHLAGEEAEEFRYSSLTQVIHWAGSHKDLKQLPLHIRRAAARKPFVDLTLTAWGVPVAQRDAGRPTPTHAAATATTASACGVSSVSALQVLPAELQCCLQHLSSGYTMRQQLRSKASSAVACLVWSPQVTKQCCMRSASQAA
jgi:hypothetical protein